MRKRKIVIQFSFDRYLMISNFLFSIVRILYKYFYISFATLFYSKIYTITFLMFYLIVNNKLDKMIDSDFFRGAKVDKKYI